MFSSAVQPGLVSLFSSTGSDPLGLFSSHTDTSLPSDSFMCLLKDYTRLPAPPPPATLRSSLDDPTEDSTNPDYMLTQTVLHIQSPTLRTTYVRCPPVLAGSEALRGSAGRSGRNELGIQHPWLCLQVRNLGKEWSFEIGIVDQAGREGIVRCSTFQKQPRLKLANSPLLHLPLSFPPSSSNPLTSWCTIAINLPSLLPYFSSATLSRSDEEEHEESDDDGRPCIGSGGRPNTGALLPSGPYSHVSYVKIYATCRVRRIWFSEEGPRQKLPWEFQLYGTD
ncbi:hypothetical protein SCP_0703320 [Sparassis crispa]|uniref:CFA20 domain-containing protein n=1 Tax=Sparassis crispa TaxID=139825 RepID=A0A401GSF7_9APHY|nr:hypothetical protein SCP_0703320 [Sparassis crispa]GBE85146.1 hypothetical protein SCP_0703320 [Sparassis crispa]